ncbi:MAG TPA: sugar phosphate nucleotidyltransferase [Dehalococcoidales bacterium]|nr:sugar phosphate nucleotidyltransferase [Dehalococcoidales bacterium]
MEKVVVIIMAGGAGERLQPLTRERSKASVPFAGKYRLIDITLSNCVNSGLRRIFVLTQYLSESLNLHIQEGWSISSSGLGDFIYCVPAQMKTGAGWFQGTADAVRQNLNLVYRSGIEDVLILAGDHVYKMDYRLFLNYHRSKGADLTISAIRTSKERAAGRLGVMEVNEEYKLLGFEEKPAVPKTLPGDQNTCLASMGIYLFKAEVLANALSGSGHDFGKQVIPELLAGGKNIFIYDYEKENHIQDYELKVYDGIREKVLIDRTRDSSCWHDVGTVDSYYETSMELIAIDPDFSLYGEKWPLRTFQKQLPPSKYILGGQVKDSIVSSGCIISGGWVDHSVLSPGVIVERDASVEHSVIFDNVFVEPGARVFRAIVDKDCRIHSGANIGYNLRADRERGCTVTDSGIVVVPKGMHIIPFEPPLL